MPDASAGHEALMSYDWEDSGGYRSTPSTEDKKPFGVDPTLSTREGSHNAVRLFEPSSREAEQIIEQNFDGSFTVDFVLSNPWWLRAAIDFNESTGTAPTTHDFSGETPDSFRIYDGNSKTSTYRVLEGCVAATVTVTYNLGGTVDVSIDGAYAFENADETSFTQPTINERALSGHDSQISRDGSVLGYVQSLTLTINNNIDLIDELGSRFAVDYNPKQRNTSIDYTRVVTDTSDMERGYGAATTLQSKVENTVPITITASNGKTGSDKNMVEFQMTDVFPDSYSRSGTGDSSADLEDALTEMAPTVSATAENGESEAR